MGYIQKDHGKFLHSYKYSGVDKSFLSRYVLCHWWNNLIKIVPLWVAPNLITLTGFMFIVISVILVAIYSPNLHDPMPNWCYYLMGVGLFIYQSLDAIDGKQARRVGASGPLGELFDHGCDALNTGLSMITAGPAFGIGGTWLLLLVMLCGLANFYLTTWEEYHTGTLYLGYFSGPVDGVLLACIMFIATGYKGPEFWTQNTFKSLLPYNLASLLDSIPDATLSECLVYATILLIIVNIVTSIRNVLSTCSPVSCLGLIPFLVLTLLNYSWILSSPHIVRSSPLPLLLYWTFGFSYTVGQIILAHVSKMRFPYVNAVILLQLAVWLNVKMEDWGIRPRLVESKYDHLFVLALASATAALYLHFSISVINQICEELGIWCVRIKPKKE